MKPHVGAMALASTLAASLAAAAPPVDLKAYRLVDLTHPFGSDTLYWPTAPTGFQLATVHRGNTPDGYFYSAYSFCAPEHGGTHMDAPVHFAEGRRSLAEVPLDQLLAPAAVIDVADRAAADPDFRLSREDVRAWEARHGAIAAGTIVLLRTGWSARWPDRKRYLGDDTPGDASRLHFPAYGKDAAAMLVTERRAAALGVDTASIDHGPSKDFIAHQVAAAANVPALENLAALDQVPPTGAWVIALPMKIAGGSGGPTRVVALVPR
jgi:kynurenine formamidase